MVARIRCTIRLPAKVDGSPRILLYPNKRSFEKIVEWRQFSVRVTLGHGSVATAAECYLAGARSDRHRRVIACEPIGLAITHKHASPTTGGQHTVFWLTPNPYLKPPISR
jgi:hypothetical protein